jgi:hypothetical protein
VKIFNKYIEKFKLVKPEEEKKSKGNGNLSLEVAEDKMKEGGEMKKVYLIVFRNQIGKALYTGIVNEKYSKIRRIEEKGYKL